MKLVYLLLFFIVSFSGFSQQADVITVAYQSQHIKAILSEDNSGKKIILPANARLADQLVITTANDQESRQWKRNFEIFDSTGQSIFKIQPATSSLYRITGKQMKDLLKKGCNYSLYTMAIPADEKIAATVRVRRVFVCGINVK